MYFCFLIFFISLASLTNGLNENLCKFVSKQSDLCIFTTNAELKHEDASTYCLNKSSILLFADYPDDIEVVNTFLYKNNNDGNKVYWLGMPYKTNGHADMCTYLNVSDSASSKDSIGLTNCFNNTFKSICSKYDNEKIWTYQSGICKEGFSRYRNKCYKKVSNVTQLPWLAAENECSKLSGHLVSITNRFVQSFISVLMGNSSTSYGNAWMGLHFNGTNKHWQWVGSANANITGNDQLEASLRTFKNWKSNEPSHGFKEECGMIYQRLTINGQWNDQTCTTKLNSYICESALAAEVRPSNISSRLTDALHRGKCSAPFVNYEDSCWYMDTKSLRTIEDAEKYCQSLHNKSNLASLHSDQEYALLDVLLDQMETSHGASELLLWIGLKVSHLKFQWKLEWLDGTDISSYTFNNKMNFEHLMYAFTNESFTTKKCAAINTTNQLIQFYPCNDTQTTAITTCQYLTHEHPANPNITCPENSKALGRRCVKVLSPIKRNFTDADRACKKLGYPRAGLVSVHNSLENSFIQEMMSKLSLPVWLGLRYNYSRIDEKILFYWTGSSKALDFLNFRAGEPSLENKEGIEELCVQMIHRPNKYGEWNDVKCSDEKHSVICEFEPDEPGTSSVKPQVVPTTSSMWMSSVKHLTVPTTSSVTSQVVPTTSSISTSSVKPGSHCKEGNVLTEGHFQYKFNKSPRMSWHTARKTCEADGAILYTPQDKETFFSTALLSWLKECFNMAELKVQYPPDVSVRVWIGLTETTYGSTPSLKDQFFWIDGFNRSNRLWQPIDEDALGTRKCIAFDLHSQQLYQESCSCDLHFFICKKNVQAASSQLAGAAAHTPQGLSSVVDLVCPEGWIMRKQMKQRYCYRAFHEAKSFREAELKCASGGFKLAQQDYHLASYANISERLWLASLTQALDSDSLAAAAVYNLNTVRSNRRHFWVGLRMGRAASLEQVRNGSSTPAHLWCFTDDTDAIEFAHHFSGVRDEALCGAIDASGYPQNNGIVSSFSCATRLPFVCKGRAYINPSSKALARPLDDMHDSIPAVGGTCEQMQRGSKCYRVLASTDSWQKANNLCRKKNMHLLVLDNAFEVAWLVSWMEAMRLASHKPDDPTQSSVWLALNVKDKRRDGADWRWENGASIRYSYWQPGGPVFKADHDCVVLKADFVVSHFTSDSHNYGMRLQPCTGSKKRFVICSSELVKKPSALLERTSCRNGLLDTTEYRGTVDKASSGKSCIRWDFMPTDLAELNRKPVIGAWPQLDPGGPAASAAECRNPDNSTDGLWCFVDLDAKKKASREKCNVPLCQLSATRSKMNGVMIVVLVVMLTVSALLLLSYYYIRRRSRNVNYGFIPYHRQNDLDPTFGGTSFHNPIYSPANA